MTAGKDVFSANSDLWVAYRATFQVFAESVRVLQAVAGDAERDRTAIEAALLAAEKARIAHNRARDRLARCMTQLPAMPGERDEARSRVRHLAKLLWELNGRPRGTEDDDWYRAERLMRAVCADDYSAASHCKLSNPPSTFPVEDRGQLLSHGL